jgi:hypothetical protein
MAAPVPQVLRELPVQVVLLVRMAKMAKMVPLERRVRPGLRVPPALPVSVDLLVLPERKELQEFRESKDQLGRKVFKDSLALVASEV